MIDGLVIRRGTARDALSLTPLFELIEALHRERLPSRFRKPPEDYARDLVEETARDPSATLFLAEWEGRPVGYVLLMIKEMPEHPLIHAGKLISVEQLVVHPEARRRRVGASLMARAEAFAKANGFVELELNVWSFNEPAKRFYESLGYRVTRTFLAKPLGG